jgi:hypothetical protein
MPVSRNQLSNSLIASRAYRVGAVSTSGTGSFYARLRVSGVELDDYQLIGALEEIENGRPEKEGLSGPVEDQHA